jgi:hypothetical protein
MGNEILTGSVLLTDIASIAFGEAASWLPLLFAPNPATVLRFAALPENEFSRGH